MKRHIFIFILIFFFCGAFARAADVTNLKSALKAAAQSAEPPRAVRPDSPRVSQYLLQENGLISVTLLTETDRFAVHPRQMVFKSGVFLQVNETDVSAKDGQISLRFDPRAFSLFSVSSKTGNFNPQMPVMLGEISSLNGAYNVSDTVILQYGSGKKQRTVFYFLLPKDQPHAAR